MNYYKAITKFWIGPASKGFWSTAGNCILFLPMWAWRNCSCLGWVWISPKRWISFGVLWTAFPKSFCLLGIFWDWELLGISLRCLNKWNPWEPAAESAAFWVAVCSWSDNEGDECWESERECSSCSESTSHTFTVLVLLLFGCKVSKK